MQPFSKHAGFFTSLKQMEDRLAAEQKQELPPPPPLSPPPLFSDTMTASPLFLGPATDTGIACSGGNESSGPALDFLTLSKDEERVQEPQEESSDDGDSASDITQLMALLGLSPPADRDCWGADSGGGCDCSGGSGFLAKVVGVVGPRCDRERRRVDGWIEHYYSGDGLCREPARLAHLVLAKASWSWDGEGPRDRAAIAFPSTVKEFLNCDAPPHWMEEHREAE